MNTTPGEATILKADGLGRVRTARERREQLLDEFERSGLTGQKFAAVVGVKYPTFATWIQKRRRAQGGGAAVPGVKSLGWLEAVMEPDRREKGALVLELPGGARLEIGDAKQAGVAAALLRALAQPC